MKQACKPRQHILGRNLHANTAIIFLWQQAKREFAPRQGYRVSMIRQEPALGLAGLLGVKDNVFTVSADWMDEGKAGCMEVRASPLANGVRAQFCAAVMALGIVQPLKVVRGRARPEVLPQRWCVFGEMAQLGK